MNTKRIIPCLDVDRGRVVKGVKFVGIRDAGDPAACARAYHEQGADELVFLDITASVEAPPTVNGGGGVSSVDGGGRDSIGRKCERAVEGGSGQSEFKHGGGGAA